MSKYINADELFNQALAEEVDVGIYQEDGSYEGIYTAVLTSDLVKMANEMPSADVVEVKHGKWVRTNPLTDTFECSLCGMQIPIPEMCSPFCPLCGADMKEVKQNDEL